MPEWLRRRWCKLMHSRISWPVNGHYRCWDCELVWRVAWEQPAVRSGAQCEGLLDGAGIAEVSR